MKHLARWKNPQADWRDADRGYMLGSWFGWKCGRDRARHLRALDAAADPFVRVAAAVYLAFDDEKEGRARLTRLTKLPGDPGAWAALTLARRGDHRAVPRMLEVLSDDRDGGMAAVPHKNLQKRVTELLSNSAKASGLPQPSGPDYRAWWKQHGARVRVQDPWFAALEAQKVD